MEIWSGKADQEHAEDFRGTHTPQPVHHLDGALEKEVQRRFELVDPIPVQVQRDPRREEESKDEVQEGDEGGDHGKGSWHEVSF